MVEIRLQRRELDWAEAVEFLLEMQLTQEQRDRLLLWGGLRTNDIKAAEREACAVTMCHDCQIAMEDGEVKPAFPDATRPGNWLHPVWDFGANAWSYEQCKAAAIRARGGDE